jgi:phospholipase C
LVCDRWFSSLPGPTWPNRLFAHSGTSKGHVDMSMLPALIHAYNQTTVYDLLSAANINWRIYYGDTAQSLLLTHQLQHPGHYHRFDDDFLKDAAGPASQFPAYTFIEPHYLGPNESDQHPVHGVQNGEALIAKVYNAIRGNADLWSSTLLIIVYDEHGGFYDHVWPDPNNPALGATVAPDGNTGKFVFNQLGIRVPAILVSPWVAKGVTHPKYDHTSILHYAGTKFGLNLNALGARVPQANGFDNEFLAQPRSDVPAPFSQFAALTVTPQTTPLTEHQHALLQLSQFLETQMAASQPAQAVKDRLLRAATLNPPDVADVVRERTDAFLTHQRTVLGKPLK